MPGETLISGATATVVGPLPTTTPTTTRTKTPNAITTHRAEDTRVMDEDEDEVREVGTDGCLYQVRYVHMGLEHSSRFSGSSNLARPLVRVGLF